MPLSALDPDQIPNSIEINDSIVAGSIPTGPEPTLSTQAIIPEPGDPVDAEWTNPGGATLLQPRFTWFVNSVEHSNELRPAGSQTATPFDTTSLSSGDQITGRVHYERPADGLIGSNVPGPDDVIHRNDVLNANLDTSPALSPSDGIANKAEIVAAMPSQGAQGPESNTITLS